MVADRVSGVVVLQGLKYNFRNRRTMRSNNFILPVTSLQRLEDIIKAYYLVNDSVTSTELSKHTNNQIISKDIAGSTTFLRNLGVIASSRAYKHYLTEFGKEFGEAIDRGDDTEISSCWEKIIDNTSFLNEIYKGLQVAKSMSQSELMEAVYRKAGRNLPSQRSKIHARTIVDILEKGKRLTSTKQKRKLFFSASGNKQKSSFINRERINSLISINEKNKDYDLSKLIELCREINSCYEDKSFYAVGLLIRSILNHVPPIFKYKSFKEVSSNYSGTRSFRESMQSLEDFSRKIADAYAHDLIKRKESLPNSTQVNFSAPLDVLLQEIASILMDE